jgi:hypothetical protein
MEAQRGGPMAGGRPYDQFVKTMALRSASRPKSGGRAGSGGIAPRESTITMLLGSTSLAFALILLGVSISGLLGISMPPWTEQQGPRWRTIYTPSLHCRVIACVTFMIGIAGLVVGLSRNHLSRLSAAGVAIILLCILIVVACDFCTG